MDKNNKTYNLSATTCFLYAAAIILMCNEALYVNFYPTVVKGIISASRLFLLIYCACKMIMPLIQTRFFLGMTLFATIVTVATYVNGGLSYIPIISKAIGIFAFYIIYSRHIKDNAKLTLSVFNQVMLIMIVLNALFVLFVPDGLWMEKEFIGGFPNRHFLGGNHNAFSPIYILALVISILYDKNYLKGKVPYNTIILSVCSLYTLIVLGSVTGIVGVTLVLTYYCFLYNKSYARWVFIALVVVFLICQVVFVLTQTVEEYSLMSSIIQDVLGKDLTFTNRTEVWSSTLELIKEQPLLGSGYRDNEWCVENIGTVHPHNLSLSLMLKGGWLLLGSYVVVIAISFIYSGLSKKSYNAFFVAFAFGSLSVMMIVEAYSTFYIFALLIILYQISYVGEEDKL